MRKLSDVRNTLFKTVHEYPPIIDAIAAHLGEQVRKPGVIFTYGDTVYDPSKVLNKVELAAHEATHVEQQTAMDKDLWWAMYVDDPKFRYEQELEAHRVELEAFEGSRNERRLMAKAIAKRLSGPLYGGVATYKKALEDLKHG